MRWSTVRFRWQVVGMMWLLMAAFPVRSYSQQSAPAFGIQSVDSVEMTVAEMDRSAKFFCEVLEFEIVDDRNESISGLGSVRRVDLRLGDEKLRLTQYIDSPGNPFPEDSRANDRWFQHIAIIVSDMDRAYQRLRRFKVRHASAGPQTLPDWNPDAGGIRAFYFRDPDGHFLEILQFPPGKGDPKWQSAPNKLFLGIDHTAIVVRDTDVSLAFYRDQLGLRIAGTSENYGDEQERLNGVFAARLRITALRADRGPGIELLEYLSPTDGRDAPTPPRANDVAHWRIHLTAKALPNGADAVEVARRIGPAGVSSGQASVEWLDPDRHVLEIDVPATRN